MNTNFSTILSVNLYSIFFFAYFFLGIASNLYVQYKSPRLDRRVFLIFGVGLILFTLYRPLPLSRDDIAYINIGKSICPFDDCGPSLQGNRDWLWYMGVSLLKSIADNERALMCLAAIGIAIKIFVIDRLCKQKLAALILLIPLTYIQYDFTQLRAGLAISWYFIGILFLVKRELFLASSFMGGNFLIHSQALPSLALLPIFLLNRLKWVLPACIFFFIYLIHAGLFPGLSLIEKLHFINIGAAPYLSATAYKDYLNHRIFPIGYLPILGYALWLCWGINPLKDRLVQTVGASVMLALLLAWIFSFNPTMQTRMFEFYIAPLVLLAGNIGSSKIKLIGTTLLALILYLRLELLNNWILG